MRYGGQEPPDAGHTSRRRAILRRLLPWWSVHHQVADASLALIACAYLLIETPYHDGPITEPATIPIMFWGDLAAYASLAWRRRFTVPVLALVWTLWLLGGRWDIWTEWNASWAELSTPTALMLMFYTAGRWSSSGKALPFLIGTLAPTALTAARVWADVDFTLFPALAPPEDLFATSFLLCAAAWVLGRMRRSEMEAVTRAEESRAELAVAEERVRIARELHDIVAHNVSAMVIQADGAHAALLDGEPAEADKAAEAIGQCGRIALGELRLLLDVLRNTPVTAQPGVEAIGHLAQRFPLRVRLHVEGRTRQVPPGLGLTAYRIVQEALTNTLKHAGKEAKADVFLRYADDGLHVRVTDDGGRETHGASAVPGSGHGLTGIAERAAMAGGTARAVPLPHRGFEVRATLPWQ